MATPFFSIVTPVYDPAPRDLQATVDSVLAQTFTDWEWIVVDDASPNPEVLAVLRSAAQAEPRIRVRERDSNGHIVRASNDALERATGEWVVLLDHDDLLEATALERVAEAIAGSPGVGYVYTDEDKIGPDGTLTGEFRKPEWSPERLRHQMYLGHLSALRHDLVRRVGGFRAGFDGSQDHDLALRVTELGDPVVHVREVLYHWRIVPGSTAGDTTAKDYASEAGLRAVRDHLDRVGRAQDRVEMARIAHTYRTIRHLDPRTLVSVVIPTRGARGLAWGVERCFVLDAVLSLLAHTDHGLLEIVVVYDSDTPDDVLSSLRETCGEALVLVEYARPFNFSEKCNLGYVRASGDVVVFLNDDVEIQSESFLEQLCAPLEEPGVGMTGARLTFSDGTIQHAGHSYYADQFVHTLHGALDEDPGPFGALVVDREVSGLTAACVALRREVIDEVGGFWTFLPSNFNDVDLSYKVRSTGRRLVWLADVHATHFESRTRVSTVHEWEHRAILERWGTPEHDLYLPGV